MSKKVKKNFGMSKKCCNFALAFALKNAETPKTIVL